MKPPTHPSNTLEFEEGFDAYFANKTRDDNPYTPDTPSYSLWDEGFFAAAEQDEDR